MATPQPEMKKRGTFRFRPIRLNRELTSSMGQTWHHILPSSEALMMTSGHQSDQTMRAARLVFRKVPVIPAETWGAANPPAINSPKTTRVKTWAMRG